MGSHRSALSEIETPTGLPRSEDEVNRSLVNTTSEELYRSKAMCVWWMLRDMVGDAALKKAIAAYRPEQDKEPSYMPRLIAAQTQRDLEWFFDDWVYRDRGLPDFKVESAFPRKTMTNGYMVTITVDNLGTAGAEVPITVKFAGGDTTKRLEVRAKSKGVIRIEIPAAPQEIVVNDGSVPESDMTNNTFKLEMVGEIECATETFKRTQVASDDRIYARRSAQVLRPAKSAGLRMTREMGRSVRRGEADERFQFFRGGAGVDRLDRQRKRFGKMICPACRHQRGRGVEQHNVSPRRFLSLQDCANDRGILLRIAAGDFLRAWRGSCRTLRALLHRIAPILRGPRRCASDR